MKKPARRGARAVLAGVGASIAVAAAIGGTAVSAGAEEAPTKPSPPGGPVFEADAPLDTPIGLASWPFGDCVDAGVAGMSLACNGGDYQRFYLRFVGDDINYVVELESVALPGQCLDADWGPVYLGGCDANNEHQQWRLWQGNRGSDGRLVMQFNNNATRRWLITSGPGDQLWTDAGATNTADFKIVW